MASDYEILIASAVEKGRKRRMTKSSRARDRVRSTDTATGPVEPPAIVGAGVPSRPKVNYVPLWGNLPVRRIDVGMALAVVGAFVAAYGLLSSDSPVSLFGGIGMIVLGALLVTTSTKP